MGIIEQFQQSLFYQWKAVGKWEPQSIWKSFFLLVVYRVDFIAYS